MVEMKKVWSRPLTVVQNFEANEYVAACGDSGVTYKFKCDAGGGKSGDVYLETNSVTGLQPYPTWVQTGENRWEGKLVDADQYLSSYYACGTTHEAESTDAFLNGYYVSGGNVTPVVVWRGPQNNNTHCTENLNMSSWETGKS